MIVVDTSALMAILLGEPTAEFCAAALVRETDILISAGTMAEALIVAGRRNVAEEMTSLVHDLGLTVVPVDGPAAKRVADAYDRWGKGGHSARLNLGDCFAYEVAARNSCPLLFVGDDFRKTDVQAVIAE